MTIYLQNTLIISNWLQCAFLLPALKYDIMSHHGLSISCQTCPCLLIGDIITLYQFLQGAYHILA